MSTQTTSQTVLAVDDEKFIRGLMTRVCQAMDNVECITASCVDEAMEVMATRDVDLIITDLTMPGGTGLKIAEQVRGQGNDVTIAVLSGSLDVNSEDDALSLGVNRVLNKPMGSVELRKVIEELLGRDNNA